MLRNHLGFARQRFLEGRIRQRLARVLRAMKKRPVEKALLERTTMTNAGDARVRYGIDGDHARQAGRIRASKSVLCPADIARTECPDLSRAPRLLDNPFDDVGPVVGIIEQHAPMTFGAESPSAIVDDNGITASGEPLGGID